MNICQDIMSTADAAEVDKLFMAALFACYFYHVFIVLLIFIARGHAVHCRHVVYWRRKSPRSQGRKPAHFQP